MGFLFGLLVVVFLFVCIVLVFLVLIQSDKGGGISGAIGGGLANANMLLGTQDTANILTRGTTIFAGSYMVICILLSLVLSHGLASAKQTSLLKKRAETQQNYSPASILDQSAAPAQGEGAAEQPAAPEPLLPPPEPAK
jgi:preprotein translocase subunit SecG